MQGLTVDPEVIEIIENFGLEDYTGMRRKIRKIFMDSRNREKNNSSRKFTERFVKIHEDNCRKSRKELLIRRHNAFVLFYLYGYSIRTIAKNQMLTRREVSRDINIVLNDMMVLVFGIDGIRQRPNSQVSVFENRNLADREEVTK